MSELGVPMNTVLLTSNVEQLSLNAYENLVAKEKKALAEVKAGEIEEQTKVIAVEKKEAESSLANALPALEAARKALQDLNKSDVTEIRCVLLTNRVI